MTRTLPIAMPLLLVALPGLASAQPWSFSVITGVPQFGPGVNIVSCDACAQGHAVRLAPGFVGLTSVYLPVNVSPGAIFTAIRLRAEDDTPHGYVRAELMRQIIFSAGPAEVIGSSTSIMVGAFQVAAATFAAPAIAPNFPYYIRITLWRGGAAANPTAYDVVLQ